MIKLLFCAITAIMLCLTLSSCSYFSQYSNVEHAKNLRVGMTKEQVLKVMGEPLRDQKYNTPDLWYYYVNTEWHDFLTTEDECMPLVFENGKLAGWGYEFYNRRYIVESKKTL